MSLAEKHTLQNGPKQPSIGETGGPISANGVASKDETDADRRALHDNKRRPKARILNDGTGKIPKTTPTAADKAERMATISVRCRSS